MARMIYKYAIPDSAGSSLVHTGGRPKVLDIDYIDERWWLWAEVNDDDECDIEVGLLPTGVEAPEAQDGWEHVKTFRLTPRVVAHAYWRAL